MLICDVGGGTTDLTLIAVGEESGRLELTRVAVGDHILLGGDNMDLALAHAAAAGVRRAQASSSTPARCCMLWHSCRAAKEKLFADPSLTSAPVTVLGRGSRVIAGTIKGELTRAEVERVLIGRLLPRLPAGRRAAAAEGGRLAGAGPALRQRPGRDEAPGAVPAPPLPRRWPRSCRPRGKKKATAGPTAVLFNGGVFKAEPLRQRVAAVLNQWAKSWGGGDVKVLPSGDLDRAVARGAAYYGMVRRGKGVRIRGGAARAYYVGVETSLPAVPGRRRR